MTCGSKVRRSLLYIFLIDEESSTDAGKNITQNITELSCSSGANCLNIGSPTRARTWDLRINSPSLYQLSYRGITGNYSDTAVRWSNQLLFTRRLARESTAPTIPP